LDLLGSNCPKLLRIEKEPEYYPKLLIARRMNELESFQFVKSYYKEYTEYTDYDIEIDSLASWSDDYEDEEEANDVEWIFE
jgi:hypothetical protein